MLSEGPSGVSIQRIAAKEPVRDAALLQRTDRIAEEPLHRRLWFGSQPGKHHRRLFAARARHSGSFFRRPGAARRSRQQADQLILVMAGGPVRRRLAGVVPDLLLRAALQQELDELPV